MDTLNSAVEWFLGHCAYSDALCRVTGHAEFKGRFFKKLRNRPLLFLPLGIIRVSFYFITSFQVDLRPLHWAGPDSFFPSLSGSPAIWWTIAITSPLSFLMKVTCAPLILRIKFVSDSG